MAGLPASGKSALAVALQLKLNAVLLDKDTVRNFLFAERVDYSNRQNDLCINIIYDVADYLLTSVSPPVVILDGRTYSRRYQINALTAVAKRTQSRLCIIECVCSETTARERLEKDQGVHLAKDRNFQMYLKSKSAAEAINEPKLVLDTDERSVEDCLQQALRFFQIA